jgi:uncharacterized protein (TIGR00375 family)
MKIIADLQLHSKYSRAVSNKMTIDEIWRWSAKKGIGIVATGDWTHPLWMREIKSKLVERGDGILEIKKEYKEEARKRGLVPMDLEPFFLLATEVSSIYMQGGKQRRVHNLIWSPSVAVAEKINAELTKRGCNLSSDGRPIVGLSSEELAQIVFEIDETCLIIPAHAWTPWFSLFGSKSGFDTVEECFGKYAKYIYAIETGLSSDPLMNWEIENLDTRSIVSFSDAHSGPKLGREATVFNLSELSYAAIRSALVNKKDSKDTISCTFEFYPEEGKYHFDGHRNCNFRQTPAETRTNGTICPVCGRELTVGVMYRIEELSNRKIKPVFKIDRQGIRWVYHPKNTRPPFVNIVPLLEIIGEALHIGTSSQKAQNAYDKLVTELNGEFNILLKASLEDIAHTSTKEIAEAVGRARAGDIFIDPGYDGVFGKVKVWPDEESSTIKEETDKKDQMSLF